MLRLSIDVNPAAAYHQALLDRAAMKEAIGYTRTLMQYNNRCTITEEDITRAVRSLPDTPNIGDVAMEAL